MKRLFTFLPILVYAIFLNGIPIEGQVQYHFFYGKVLTADTREPLANVNISFVGSKMGSITDQKGAFSFYIDTIPVFMVVSHLGYKSKRVLLDGKSNSMTLYLEKEIRELKEVEIRANKIEPFFRDEHFTIRDYEIDSGMVYLLVYRNRISKEELICKNLEGDTVARSGILLFTPVSILKDCLGYLHVIGKDSVYQVYRQDRQLEMIHPVGMEKFNDVLLNCVASTSQVLFFKKMINLSQGVQYYGIDRVSLKRYELTQVIDEQKAKMLRRNPEDIWSLMGSQPDFSPDNLVQYREEFLLWNFTHKTLYRPIKTALYRIGDFICIFNIPAKELEFFDLEGHFSYKLKISIDEIKDGRWSGDIFLDESQSKVYTSFLKSSGTGLYRIDLNTGELHKILSLIHPYPQKIRIYKDQVYYLYDILGDPDNKTLFRQNL
ncbi:MAG: carboxypeptidase-like regulatory domain-containing protein [Bacteroidetes bacterium]|nr:carboxypeptidase-like regulatory domain-containing protein [Bacteroidota bacterium]